ncbi:MAG: class I SAM-dependent methyltransferase [Verrucomicrobia bacterium]|nr:class I SAM-dependent methyltransferase [Verrucomicrobiota bacterium]
MKKPICGLCSGKRVSFYKYENAYKILKCESCNVKFLPQEELNKINLKTLYSKKYFKTKNKIGYENYLNAEKIHRRNFQRIIKKVLKKRLNKTTKVCLDFGCAHGFLLDELRKKNITATGIEISKTARLYAKKKLKLEVYEKIQDLGNRRNVYDAIFLIGVVEHLKLPKEIFTRLLKLMKHEGTLCITTLDCEGVFPFFSYKPPEHTFYFSHSNLIKILLRCGFSKISYKTLWVEYSVFDIVFRIFHYFNLKNHIKILAPIQKAFSELTLKIPTNEIILFAEKYDHR